MLIQVSQLMGTSEPGLTLASSPGSLHGLIPVKPRREPGDEARAYLCFQAAVFIDNYIQDRLKFHSLMITNEPLCNHQQQVVTTSPD